jgi:hypothetical protein
MTILSIRDCGCRVRRPKADAGNFIMAEGGQTRFAAKAV